MCDDESRDTIEPRQRARPHKYARRARWILKNARNGPKDRWRLVNITTELNRVHTVRTEQAIETSGETFLFRHYVTMLVLRSPAALLSDDSEYQSREVIRLANPAEGDAVLKGKVLVEKP